MQEKKDNKKTNLHLNAPNVVDDRGQVHSIYPCTGYITFGAWIYLVPQYKPKSVLMLGYGGGTAAGLIRMFYGDVPITAVDTADCSEFNYYDVELIQEDAEEFVKDCKEYDAVIVDLYEEGSYTAQPFVFTDKFVENLERIARYIIVHGVKGDDMSAYKNLNHVRTLRQNTGNDLDGMFHYYSTERIAELPIR